MPEYRLHDTTGDDLGLIEHPAPNVEPGDVAVLLDGRQALVTARVEAQPGSLTALLAQALLRRGAGGDGGFMFCRPVNVEHVRRAREPLFA